MSPKTDLLIILQYMYRYAKIVSRILTAIFMWAYITNGRLVWHSKLINVIHHINKWKRKYMLDCHWPTMKIQFSSIPMWKRVYLVNKTKYYSLYLIRVILLHIVMTIKKKTDFCLHLLKHAQKLKVRFGYL